MIGTDIEWPSFEDISLALHSAALLGLTPKEFGIFTRLAWAVACASVNGRYTAASPTYSIPAADDRVALIAGCTKRQWADAKPSVLPHFIERDGRLYLRDEGIVRISKRSTRSAVPTSVKAEALSRDGRRCAYCGDVDGPFHFDHLFPVSRGGTNDASNIVVACQPCNLSKSDRTILEWTTALRGTP